MKIGIDIRALGGQRTGIGRYLGKLLGALAEVDRQNEYALFFSALKTKWPQEQLCGFDVISSRWPNKILGKLWSISSFPSIETLMGRLDLFHAPNFQMPPTKSAASVLTIHDLVFMKYPEMAIPAAVKEYAPKMKLFADRADLIISDSVATSSDIVDLLNIQKEKIVTVYPGATTWPRASDDDIAKMRSKYALNGDYILFVGCLEPRKNISRLITAFDRSTLSRDFSLVLAGPWGWHTQEIIETLESLPSRKKIQRIDYVTDEWLPALYSGATFLAFPSILEGFGLPILEAMSVGCPVLTSNISSMPEVGGEAALYVDPFDIDSIAEGLKRLACDSALRDKLSRAGYERVKLFTWENTARQTIDVYNKAAEINGLRRSGGVQG